jgi:hypothetical protein
MRREGTYGERRTAQRPTAHAPSSRSQQITQNMLGKRQTRRHSRAAIEAVHVAVVRTDRQAVGKGECGHVRRVAGQVCTQTWRHVVKRESSTLGRSKSNQPRQRARRQCSQEHQHREHIRQQQPRAHTTQSVEIGSHRRRAAQSRRCQSSGAYHAGTALCSGRGRCPAELCPALAAAGTEATKDTE